MKRLYLITAIICVVFIAVAIAQAQTGLFWRLRKPKPVPTEIKEGMLLLLGHYLSRLQKLEGTEIGTILTDVDGTEYEWTEQSGADILAEKTEVQQLMNAISDLP